MSKLPVDIVNFDNSFNLDIVKAIETANNIQNDFIFTLAPNGFRNQFILINYEDIEVNEFLEKALIIKNKIKGYYPFVIFITDSPLKGEKWTNLFNSTRSEDGVMILTTKNVPDIIIPKASMISYFLYYFANTALKYILVKKYNHYTPSRNGCLFDFKENKKDILKSMRANSICDDCKKEILRNEMSISESQFDSIDKLLSSAGEFLSNTTKREKAKLFIGSSKEGLNIARKIKTALKYDGLVDTWADGLFDRPGFAYIEVLESVLLKYDYGIFVFTPDDRVYSRGNISDMPRDNVIFEYGMFLGKHTRKKAFIIKPRNKDIKIMTDVLGITCLDYDSENPNVISAVNDACDQIRDIISEDEAIN
jgi:predicted nucleotide-binding protein